MWRPPLLTSAMACRKTARRAGTKKRAQRATSNVFAMFDQDQIQEFKEAFNMIDQNRDGFIDHDDLKDMLASLGKVRLSLLFCLLRLSAPLNIALQVMGLSIFPSKG